MNRSVWSSIVLGLWLMISPSVLALANRRIFGVLWEDLLLGFGIATFSLSRLLSRNKREIVLTDWLVLVFGLLTLVNPFLYAYANAPLARWNNWLIGGTVVLLALYQNWKDAKEAHLK